MANSRIGKKGIYTSGLPIAGPQAQIWVSGTNWDWDDKTGKPIAATVGTAIPQIIGAARNISVQNQYSRSPLVGIGSFYLNEAPALLYSGNCSMDAYMLCANRGIMNAYCFEYSDEYEFFLFMLYNAGIDVTLMVDRVKQGKNGFSRSDFAEVVFAFLESLLLTEDSFTISESELAGKNGSFLVPRPPKWIGSGEKLKGNDGLSSNLNVTADNHAGNWTAEE